MRAASEKGGDTILPPSQTIGFRTGATLNLQLTCGGTKLRLRPHHPPDDNDAVLGGQLASNFQAQLGGFAHAVKQLID